VFGSQMRTQNTLKTDKKIPTKCPTNVANYAFYALNLSHKGRQPEEHGGKEMNKKYLGSIGGNGFQEINYYAVEQIVASKVSLKVLATKSSQISHTVNTLTRILQSMPAELFDMIGADIIAAGEKLNDAAGAIAIAHDKKAGF
jgi:hypothetical protein